MEPFGSARRKQSIQLQRRENEQWTRPKTQLDPGWFRARTHTHNLALSQPFASIARFTVITHSDLQICLTRKKENLVCSDTIMNRENRMFNQSDQTFGQQSGLPVRKRRRGWTRCRLWRPTLNPSSSWFLLVNNNLQTILLRRRLAPASDRFYFSCAWKWRLLGTVSLRILAPSFPVRRLQLAPISSFHLPPVSFSLPTRCEWGKLRAAACKRLPRGGEEGSPPRRRVRKSVFIPPLWSDPRASSSTVWKCFCLIWISLANLNLQTLQ